MIRHKTDKTGNYLNRPVLKAVYAIWVFCCLTCLVSCNQDIWDLIAKNRGAMTGLRPFNSKCVIVHEKLKMLQMRIRATQGARNAVCYAP